MSRVLDRLRDAGLLDDREFARFWVENRETFRPKGALGLSYELRQKGVPREIIEQSLEGLNARESAYRAAVGRAARMAHLEQPIFYRRLSGFLQRRGFGYKVIRETVDRLWEEVTEQRNEETD